MERVLNKHRPLQILQVKVYVIITMIAALHDALPSA
jgi:hypothetical protein